MTLKEANRVRYNLEQYEIYKDLDGEIRRLHQEQNINELSRMALELAGRLAEEWRQKITSFNLTDSSTKIIKNEAQ